MNRGRRGFLERSGVIVATFALGLPTVGAQTSAAAPPVSFAKNGRLDGWIAVNDQGAVTVFTGKVELGQGILTALAQIAAEEMDVDLDQVQIVSGNTVRGPDEGYTFGSQSVEQSGSAVRAAGAFARATLVAAAAKRLDVDPAALTVESGVVRAPDGRRIGYGEIVRDEPKLLERDVSQPARPKAPDSYRIVGKPSAKVATMTPDRSRKPRRPWFTASPLIAPSPPAELPSLCGCANHTGRDCRKGLA